MSNIELKDIDDFCRRMKIDIALLVELLDRFEDEQVNKYITK